MRRYEESIIQKTFVRWMQNNHPKILFTCSPAVAKSARQGHENKLHGYLKGWPDLFFALSKRGYFGLFIEFKTPKGSIDKQQREVMDELDRLNYKVVVCRSPEEAILTLQEYLK